MGLAQDGTIDGSETGVLVVSGETSSHTRQDSEHGSLSLCVTTLLGSHPKDWVLDWDISELGC